MSGLPHELYLRCRAVLLKCRQLDSDAQLRAIFTMSQDLYLFRDDLPTATDKTTRVELCLAFLQDKQIADRRYSLPLFLTLLHDLHNTGDHLRSELDQVRVEVTWYFQQLNGRQLRAEPSNPRHSASDTLSISPNTQVNESIHTRKDFFISYNKADRDWAIWIAWQLEDVGYVVVLQAWDFRPGGNFVLDMQRSMADADRTIAVLSPDYLTSRFTQPEWAGAFAKDPTGEQGLLLPVRVRACKLTGLLPQIVYIDMVDLTEDQARTVLLEGVQLGRSKPTTAPRFPGSRSKPPFPESPGSDTSIT